MHIFIYVEILELRRDTQVTLSIRAKLALSYVSIFSRIAKGKKQRKTVDKDLKR